MASGTIYCFMVSGGPLSIEDADLLYVVGYSMARDGERKQVLDFPGVTGMITTTMQSACLGGVAGIVFDAILEIHETRQAIKVRYLIRESDFDGEPPAVAWSDDGTQHPVHEELMRGNQYLN